MDIELEQPSLEGWMENREIDGGKKKRDMRLI